MAWSLEEHYAQRCLEIERAVTELEPDGPRPVVLLGDSLTEGHPARTLGRWPVSNQGISGDQAAHATCGAGRRLELVARARPSAVFLLTGIAAASTLNCWTCAAWTRVLEQAVAAGSGEQGLPEGRFAPATLNC